VSWATTKLVRGQQQQAATVEGANFYRTPSTLQFIIQHTSLSRRRKRSMSDYEDDFDEEEEEEEVDLPQDVRDE
jgi:hypothetical protein